MTSTQGTSAVPPGLTPTPFPPRRAAGHAETYVTDRWLVTPYRRYKITELLQLRTARRGPHPFVPAVIALLGVILASMVLAVSFLRGEVVLPRVLIAAVIPVALAWLVWHLQRHRYELWADYRGRTLLVFSTSDETTFGHVCRALIRARDATTPTRQPPAAGTTFPVDGIALPPSA